MGRGVVDELSQNRGSYNFFRVGVGEGNKYRKGRSALKGMTSK